MAQDRSKPPEPGSSGAWKHPATPDDGFPPVLAGEYYRLDLGADHGGMGEVRIYEHRSFDRLVAVKSIRRDQLHDAEWRAWLEREARNLAQLRDENVAGIYAAVEHEGRPFLIIEHIEGPTLRARLLGGPLSIDEALDIAADVAHGVRAAHRKGIVHRDLKPDNIILRPLEPHDTRRHSAVVIDFGIARALGDADAGGTCRGIRTLQYASPEQTIAEAAPSMDLWSFGCVLHECLTRRMAFPQGALGHRDDQPRPPGVPAGIDALIERCVARDPAARPTIEEACRILADARGSQRRAEPGPHNLGQPLTPFIGRSSLVDRVRDQLSSSRLVTLRGLGGFGKTRLALEVARLEHRRGGFPGGTWLVDLASIDDVAGAVEAIFATLNVTARNGAPPGQTLTRHLRDQRTLLVLDNADDIAPELGAAVRDLVSCPALHVLCTSRVALGVAGEQVVVVGPMPVPAAGDLLSVMCGNDALRLFAAHVPGGLTLDAGTTPTVRRICEALDGIPLAVAMVAAQLTEALDLEDLATHAGAFAADDEGPLPDIFDWSRARLSEDDRRLLAEVSVFRGGWTLDGAEAVIDDHPAVARGLAHLVRCSLVVSERRAEGRRYRLLDTLRFHETAALDGRRRDRLLARHLHWYVSLVERAEADHAAGRHQLDWQRRIAVEHLNILLAIDTANRDASADQLVRLLARLDPFWSLRGHAREGRARLEPALAWRGNRDDDLQAHGLNVLGHYCWRTGDLDGAREAYRHANAILEERGDVRALAALHSNIAIVEQDAASREAERGNEHLATQHRRTAREEHGRALALYRQLDDDPGFAKAELNLGVLLMDEPAHHRDARLIFDRCALFFDEHGDLHRAAVSLFNSAEMLRRADRLHDALARFRSSLERRLSVGEPIGIAWTMIKIGLVAERLGLSDDAAMQLGVADQLLDGHSTERLLRVSRDRTELADRLAATMEATMLASARRLGRVNTDHDEILRAADVALSSVVAGHEGRRT